MGWWRPGGGRAASLTVALLLGMLSVCVLIPAVSAAAITPQGAKLTGAGESVPGDFGWSVALSADGNTAVIGGYTDTNDAGAVAGLYPIGRGLGSATRAAPEQRDQQPGERQW